MESLIIPGIMASIVALLSLVKRIWHCIARMDTETEEAMSLTQIVLVVLIFIALIVCPISRNVSSRDDAIIAQSYYTNLVQPHIIEEFGDYVVVSSGVSPAMWQSGAYNLAAYNSYLATARYWNDLPLIGSMIYPPSSELRFVRVQGGEV